MSCDPHQMMASRGMANMRAGSQSSSISCVSRLIFSDLPTSYHVTHAAKLASLRVKIIKLKNSIAAFFAHGVGQYNYYKQIIKIKIKYEYLSIKCKIKVR